jgi:hypothetical protein
VDPTVAVLARDEFEDAAAVRYYPAERYSRADVMRLAVKEGATFPFYGVAGTPNTLRANYLALRDMLLEAGNPESDLRALAEMHGQPWPDPEESQFGSRVVASSRHVRSEDAGLRLGRRLVM